MPGMEQRRGTEEAFFVHTVYTFVQLTTSTLSSRWFLVPSKSVQNLEPRPDHSFAPLYFHYILLPHYKISRKRLSRSIKTGLIQSLP